MFVRIATTHAQQGKVQEFGRMWEENVLPRLKEIPGFIRAYQTADMETGKMVGIVFWESRPDEEEFAKRLPQMAQAMSSVATGRPTFEDFEVLAES